MRDTKRRDRRAEIARTAYGILAEKGYRGLTMSGLARAVGASNETLYKWYGDKDGLIRALIEEHAAQAQAIVAMSLEIHDDAIRTLERLGPVLLTILSCNQAIALSRAAAADPTGQTGQLMAKSVKGTILPLLAGVIEQGIKETRLTGQTEPLTDLYLSLLLGDSQAQLMMGAGAVPDEADRYSRAKMAFDQFLTLAGASP